MRRFPREMRMGKIGSWMSIFLLSVSVIAGTGNIQSATAGVPVFGQISGVPVPGPSGGEASADPTFQRALMIAVCFGLIFVLSLICYLVVFRALLNVYWPRTAYAAATAIFCLGTTSLILGMFWQSLRYHFTPGEAWYNEHGVRALLITQAIVSAVLLVFTKRSEGPFPVLIKDRPAKSK